MAGVEVLGEEFVLLVAVLELTVLDVTCTSFFDDETVEKVFTVVCGVVAAVVVVPASVVSGTFEVEFVGRLVAVVVVALVSVVSGTFEVEFVGRLVAFEKVVVLLTAGVDLEHRPQVTGHLSHTFISSHLSDLSLQTGSVSSQLGLGSIVEVHTPQCI